MSSFVRNRLALFGLACLAVLGLGALLAPWLAPYPPDRVNPRDMLQAPSWAHPLGTDDIGRDALSRLLFAGRTSLGLALGAAGLAALVGTVLGALAGFFGRWLDGAVSALVDTLLSIPVLALAMVAATFVSLDAGRLVLVLSLVAWPTVARLVRGQVLSLREQAFVEAAYAVGGSRARVLFRHVLPNALTPVWVAGSLLVAYAILIESALSFLGFGLPPPTATWGGMLNDAQLYYRNAPWLAVAPGAAIALAVAGVNFVGEGLREALDPRSQ